MSGAAATSPIVDRATRNIDPCPLFTPLIRFQNHKLVFNCEHRHRPASLTLLLPIRLIEVAGSTLGKPSKKIRRTANRGREVRAVVA
jgi:hypothetical protein